MSVFKKQKIKNPRPTLVNAAHPTVASYGLLVLAAAQHHLTDTSTE